MYGRSPERRRQKQKGARTFRVDDDLNVPQYFQISVNVLEARRLAWSNSHSANSYVVVVLGKKKYRSNIRMNTNAPYYKECFVFEMFTSILNLKRSCLWLAVMESRCCAPSILLGEATINLETVWTQPHHQAFHKWVQLSQPHDTTTGPVGFLKVDVSIIFRGNTQMLPTTVNQLSVVEDIILPCRSEQQTAKYLITVYEAFNLPNGMSDRRPGKAPSTFVRVSFCGRVANTAVQHRTHHPKYCEQVSIVDIFPNLCQLVRLEVCYAENSCNRVLGSTHLKLEQISHDGENGFLPTFGPSLLHMYGTSFGISGTVSIGEDGPFYRGALLVSLRTIVPFYQGIQGCKPISVEPVTPIKVENLWNNEDFFIYCPIFEVSMLDRRISGRQCGVAITVGEIFCDNNSDDNFCIMQNELRARKMHYTGSLEVTKSKATYGYLDFQNGYPVLQLALRLPDFRFRMYRNNMAYGIVNILELSIADVECRLKKFEYSTPSDLVDILNDAQDIASRKIRQFLDLVQNSKTKTNTTDVTQHSTDLNQKQLVLQMEEMGKTHQMIEKRLKYSSMLNVIGIEHNMFDHSGSATRKSVKLLMAEIKAMTQKLRKLIIKTESWPDVIVWLLNGGSRVAYTKIPIDEIICSVIPEQSGRNCGRIQTVYLKPLRCPKHVNTHANNCCCIAGKIELLLWMGLHRQNSHFEDYLPHGLKLRVREYQMTVNSTLLMLEYRIFIYKAKLNNFNDNTNFSEVFIRVNAINSIKDTKPQQTTKTPVWNQILRIQKLTFTTTERLANNPPTVLIEVYENDLSEKHELIGRCQILPVVDDRQDFEHAPKLQWHEIKKGEELSGQVLMSVQLLQIPEMLMKSTFYSPVEETYYTTDFQEADRDSGQVEPLPINLIPKSATYKLDIYWWGLRDVNNTRKPCAVLQIDDILIKSDIICGKKVNSNFPNGRNTQIFQGPLNEAYRFDLSVKLYDSGTFGRTLHLGANVVKNSNKFMVNWLPKHEREASLKSASINSSEFLQVNHMTFIKKRRFSVDEIDESSSNITVKSSKKLCKAKQTTWNRIFSRKPSEEQYILLPMFAKENDQLNLTKKTLKQSEEDWWLRYFCSQKDYNSKDKICDCDKMVIYDSELESQPEFSKFKDWCSAIKFYNGTKSGIPDKDEQLYCGILKVGIAIYNWPPPFNTIAVNSSGVELNNGYFDDLPSNEPAQFRVRVYLVRGIDIRKKDFTEQSDPYIVLECGKKRLGDRESFVKKIPNPIFGRMYEFCCNLPEDYLLTISLYDNEAIQPDEFIGSTVIDLEDRIYSKHRARVGLSTEYNSTGPCKWRDCVKPSEILKELCAKNHLPLHTYPDQAILIVNGVEYRDNDKDKPYLTISEKKENICLNLLHNWNKMPLCGYHLVPEHVETRTLYNTEKPKHGQGKIQMWVDVFPLTGSHIPPPVDITPRNLEDYELRLIVWNIQQLKLDYSETSKKAPDIYVKAWIGSVNQAQDTDIHYRCTNGEGHFNWRMIFNFKYQHVENKVIVKETGPFTEYEERVPPILVIQVMDMATELSDDFIGTLTLNLNALPKGEKLASKCTLESMQKARKFNLFLENSIRSKWPLWTVDITSEKKVFAGVIDMELTLLSKEKASLMPVGLGRNSPHPLPEPKCRKATSIFFCTNANGFWNYNVAIVFAIFLFVTLLICTAIYFDMMPDCDYETWNLPGTRMKRNQGLKLIKKLPNDLL